MGKISFEQKYNIDNNMIHFSELYKAKDIDVYFPLDGVYAFDSESCFTTPNTKIVNGEEIKIEPFLRVKSGLKDKLIPNPEFNTDVKVYAWFIANTKSDKVIYGEDLKDFIPTMVDIIKRQKVNITQYTKSIKAKFFIHNLKWDLEFLKYTLLEECGYNYWVRPLIKSGTKINTLAVQPKGTISIVESNNEVYSARVVADEPYKVGNKHYNIELTFIDSFKILAMSLDSIAKDVIDIEPMYYKMSEEYDYDTHRPKGYQLSDFEKAYGYNDVYILKEFINQFYSKANTEQYTASGIAFEDYLKRVYKKDNLKDNYAEFIKDYPDLTNNPLISKAIDASYNGGWTQANKKYLNIDLEFENGVVAIDFNSSYPSVVLNNVLPYGEPRLCKREVSKEECTKKGYQLRLFKVCFDGFKNKGEGDTIGHIKNTADNIIYKNDKSSKYLDTNFIDGVPVGSSNPSDGYSYSKYYWDFELENILKYVDFYIKETDDSLGIPLLTGEVIKGYHISETVLFKGKVGHFAEAVKYWTDVKIKAKKEGNKALYHFAKLMLNSFTGKMASDSKRKRRELVLDGDGTMHFRDIKDKEGNVSCYNESKKYYKAFTSAITAYARCNLRDTMYEIGYDNILYFDTDSLYTTLTAEEVKAKLGDKLHPTDLGKLDIETEYIRFKTLGAKKYIVLGRKYREKTKKGKNGYQYYDKKAKKYLPHPYDTICKCSGLPKDVANTIEFEDFELNKTFRGKKTKVAVKGGYALLEGDFTLTDLATYSTNA